MSNLEKYNGFFETELACLPAEQIDKYVQEKLSKKEKYQFEKHLLSCEFCNEAVEGISTFENSINLGQISKQINSEIAEKYLSKDNKKVPLFSYFKVAASVIILITAGLFVFDKSFPENQNMAFSKKKEGFEESAPIEEEKIAIDLLEDSNPVVEKENETKEQKKDKSSKIREKKAIKTEQKNQTRNLSTSPNISKKRIENTNTKANLEAETVTSKDNDTEDLTDFSAQEMEEISDDKGLDFVSEISQEPLIEERKAKNITSSSQGASLVKQNLARKDDETKKYSLKKLKKELKKNPSDLDLRYQYALAYFEVKQWKKSSVQFNKILSDSLQIHYYDAIWYSALIDIEEKKLKLAKEKLKKLLTNKVYGAKAKEKLKEIE